MAVRAAAVLCQGEKWRSSGPRECSLPSAGLFLGLVQAVWYFQISYRNWYFAEVACDRFVWCVLLLLLVLSSYLRWISSALR